MFKVRLREEEIKAIIEAAKEVFGEDVKVWLFGSRARLEEKGGDIDIYIEADIPEDEILKRKLKFLIKLEERIGEQKIDVIVKPFNSGEEISIVAKTTGVKLV